MEAESDIYHVLHHIDKLILVLNIAIFRLNFYELHQMYNLKLKIR